MTVPAMPLTAAEIWIDKFEYDAGIYYYQVARRSQVYWAQTLRDMAPARPAKLGDGLFIPRGFGPLIFGISHCGPITGGSSIRTSCRHLSASSCSDNS